MPLDTRRVAQADGHDHADQLVRLAVERLQRIDLREPGALHGVQLREDLVQRLLEREAPVLVVHRRNTGIVMSSEIALQSTRNCIPISMSSNSTPSMFVITR